MNALAIRREGVEKMKTSSNLHELAREPGIERKLGVRIRTSRSFREKKRRKGIFSPLPCAE